ncbi:hypothetical protein ACQ4WX_25665 [Streptomyces lasalocidi]
MRLPWIALLPHPQKLSAEPAPQDGRDRPSTVRIADTKRPVPHARHHVAQLVLRGASRCRRRRGPGRE